MNRGENNPAAPRVSRDPAAGARGGGGGARLIHGPGAAARPAGVLEAAGWSAAFTAAAPSKTSGSARCAVAVLWLTK